MSAGCRRRRARRRYAALILFLGTTVTALVIVSCAPATRHRALTFFFDGVPDPGAEDAPREISPQFIRDEIGRSDPTRPRMIPHEPFRRRQCRTCHSGEQSLYLSADFDRSGECYSCHEHTAFKEKVESYRFQHGPVAVASCIVCHSPHESMLPSLLEAPDPDLCYRCHQRDDLSKAPHGGGAEEKCLPCHEPHGGERKFFLRPAADRPWSGATTEVDPDHDRDP